MMDRCYMKVFICDEIDGCEIGSLCGLRDNEEMAVEAQDDIFEFLREKLEEYEEREVLKSLEEIL